MLSDSFKIMVLYRSIKTVVFSEIGRFQFRNAIETETREIWVKQHDNLRDFSLQCPKCSQTAFAVKSKFTNLI